MKTYKIFIAITALYTGLNANNLTAYFGDRMLQRTVIIDVNNMSEITDIVTEGEGHYSVNQAGELNKAYVDTRKSNFLEIINTETNTYQGKIELEHKVRSSDAYNEYLGLQLVNGSDKPMASLIDVNTDNVVATVGDNTVYPPNGDYGGGNATGHPFWLSNNKFVLIDRPNRLLKVYKIWKKQNNEWQTRLLSTKKTKTAIHHFLKGKKNKIFYALAEGSPQNNISPYIIKYKLKRNGKLIKKRKVKLSRNVNSINMGAHHMDIHPNKKIMYVGSTEGIVYVINLKRMKVIGSILAGKGAGHTTFIPNKNIAIITNHKDKFISVIDTRTHALIKNIVVSGDSQNNAILQSHTSFVDENSQYFYSFATDNGIFYQVDLNTLEVTSTLNVGGTPLQGFFLKD